MDRSGWIQDSTFIPSLWLHPLAQDKAGCAKTVGNYIVGTMQGYDKRDGGGSDSHFFTFLVTETNVKDAQVYTPGEGGKGTYTPIPFKAGEFYSLRAPGNLFHQLKRYGSDANFAGVPLEITYMGLKEIDTANPRKPGETMKVDAHQYRVRRDPTWQPQLGVAPIMQLTGPSTPAAEQPFPDVPAE